MCLRPIRRVNLNVVKSLVFAAIVVLLELGIVFLLTKLDLLLDFKNFQSGPAIFLGALFIFLGAALRFWAAFVFYQHQLKVISLRTQSALMIEGPYKFCRNPLYLGIILIFLGAALFFGTWSGLAGALIVFLLFDLMARKEEKELARAFGQTYLDYKSRVRRWL